MEKKANSDNFIFYACDWNHTSTKTFIWGYHPHISLSNTLRNKISSKENQPNKQKNPKKKLHRCYIYWISFFQVAFILYCRSFSLMFNYYGSMFQMKTSVCRVWNLSKCIDLTLGHLKGELYIKREFWVGK